MKFAIIPARGGSKRIPDKNIVDFLGSPLMSYSIRAAESKRFDAIHVSTDSELIAGVAARFGYPVDFMRMPSLPTITPECCRSCNECSTNTSSGGSPSNPSVS